MTVHSSQLQMVILFSTYLSLSYRSWYLSRIGIYQRRDNNRGRKQAKRVYRRPLAMIRCDVTSPRVIETESTSRIQVRCYAWNRNIRTSMLEITNLNDGRRRTRPPIPMNGKQIGDWIFLFRATLSRRMCRVKLDKKKSLAPMALHRRRNAIAIVKTNDRFADSITIASEKIISPVRLVTFLWEWRRFLVSTQAYRWS